MVDWSGLSVFTAVLAVVVGYLCGSIPFGLLLTRWAGLGDVRKIGSGNIGATNVLRTGSKKIAALTLILDAVKATIPVLVFREAGGEAAALVAGFAALAGHLFPAWLNFKGGKGVATAIGLLLGIAWLLGLAFLAVWLIVAFLFRTSSVSALAASALTPLWAYLLGRPDLVIPTILLAVIVWLTHRANIARLIAGTEPKIDLGRRA
ncbi:MAG: glycerol-3-phosphate 1-O-acyltransferase PlsY [Rhizobiales bacterium]|nr:glycerol-3-phosphate 1-O-acyltransferase PlsY [Hyphomicrobiales bacterium]